MHYGGIEELTRAVFKIVGGKMSKLKKRFLAICNDIYINAKVGGNVQGFYEHMGKRGELTVWESENLHPGEQYISFKPEDGKSELQTSCGRIEIKNDTLTIRTHKNKNIYSFFLLNPIQTIEFKMRLPHRFLHVCDGCGKREILSSREAFEQGWDYPGPDGIYKDMPSYGFGVLAPRTCGQCTIDKSLYWKLTMDKDAPNCMKQEEIEKALERIRNEPISLIIDGDEINELQL